VHRNAAHILAVIVGQRDSFAVLMTGFYFLFPFKIFIPVFISRETIMKLPVSQSTRTVIPGVQRAGTLKQQPPPPPETGL
jgi:hypothetical protein